MKIYKWIEKKFFYNRTLQYKLNIIFSFFFLLPVMGLIYFGIRYELLNDRLIPIFFLGVLGFSLIGLYMLRTVFYEITGFSKTISGKMNSLFPEVELSHHKDELHKMMELFNIIDSEYTSVVENLEQRCNEISTLKDLSELCYVTSDPDEILYIVLERALDLTASSLGSILLLEEPDRKYFKVKACIGVDKYFEKDDHIEFETSIAKYAVLNKTPLVIEDIEKDNRFGRTNRLHYGTKSFICIPIKTSRDIIGVMTISRKEDDRVYTQREIEVLFPLLSNAAFTYENLNLLRYKTKVDTYLGTMASTLNVITSSFRNSELLHAFLNEIKSVISYATAVVLLRDDSRADQVYVFDMVSNQPMMVSKGGYLALEKSSMIEKAFRQESIIILNDTMTLHGNTDRALLCEGDNRSAAITPLKIDGAVKGVLILSGENPAIFHETRILLEWLARAFSLAIERNQLLAAVVKRDRELDSIKQIGSALATSTFDIKQVLNYTMDMIHMIMNVEAGALYLVKENELEFAAAFNIDENIRDMVRIRLGEGIPGYVAAKGESIIVNETQSSGHFLPRMNTKEQIKPRSALCVPMISQGRVVGVIEVLNKIGQDFTHNDEDLLQSIASSVSIAIENANLYKETVSMAENERGIRRMFQKFVPKEVLDKILHGSQGEAEMVEELKTLTLINIDLRGFSSLSKELGPQRTVMLLNHFFSITGGIIFKHNGIVDKYLGDGFLAIFGAPVSSISDTDNAVNAALEMRESVAGINDTLAQDLGVVLTIGISIHTGEVVVGNIGFDMKMDYTVIGDSVNDVFRLQDLTKPYPNSILLSDKTLRAARTKFDTAEFSERLGDMKIHELLGKVVDHNS
ncbi:MAG: GAF domain-containing protein [Desulfobacteraceae bacterium]|nr:GAF domain-containing protein [Desulfobacteraceae bacterium]